MNINALPPELQRLVDEPLSEPPARACDLWRPLARAMEKLDRIRQQQASYDLERARLRQELDGARQRDQRALGEALANGQPEPEPEAAAIEKNIERAAARYAANSPA